MITIAWGKPEFKYRDAGESREIFDVFRKKWVVLTPEEWVRQNLLRYLSEVKGYPKKLMAVERLVKVGERSRRFDAVVYNRQGLPWMLIECKRDTELLTEKVHSQLTAYQSQIGAGFMLMSNGMQTRCWQIVAPTAFEIAELPEYE